MKQIKIAALLLMASSSVYAMEQKDDRQDNLRTTTVEQFLCQSCHQVDLSIPGNESRHRNEICKHRCCRLCTCEVMRGSRGALRCPVCGAFSSKQDRCDCRIVAGACTAVVLSMLAAHAIYGPVIAQR